MRNKKDMYDIIDEEIDALDISEEQKKALKELSYVNKKHLVESIKQDLARKKETLPQISSSSQGDEKSILKEHYNRNNSQDKIYIEQCLNDDFFNKLGWLESTNDYAKEHKDNDGIGAIGKYQMRGLGLIDLGYLDKNYRWTGKNGLYSIADFKQDKDLQEQIVRDFCHLNYNYLRKNGAISYIGKEISGKVDNFKITVSGLLAAAHKEGAGGVNKYLKRLEKNKSGNYYLPYDKYRGNLLRGLLAVETRLRTFSDVDEN